LWGSRKHPELVSDRLDLNDVMERGATALPVRGILTIHRLIRPSNVAGRGWSA
jgi:hypothetical protein